MTRPLVITFRVASCTAYTDADLPSYSELFEKAWILKPCEGRRLAGFVRASDLPFEERVKLRTDIEGDDRSG
jgi:hypothetical protein